MRRGLWVLCIAALLGVAQVQAAPGTAEIGRWDRLWASWDGIDPEVYMMMSDMDQLMTDMIRKASIAKESRNESDFQDWLGEKINDNLIDIATDYNPAVSPIKKMYDYSMQGTRSWLDWGMRKSVDIIYDRYTRELQLTGSPNQAVAATSRWLDEQQQIVSNLKIARDLEVIRQNREMLFAYIVKTHKKYHASDYQSGAGRNAQPTPANEAGGRPTLAIRVLDSRYNTPIGGARIKLSGAANSRGQSDPSGWIYLDLPTAGNYTLEVSATGYDPVSGQRYLGGARSAKAKVLLKPMGSSLEEDNAEAKSTDADACYAPVEREIQRLRAHNQAQNWQSGNVTVLTLDRDPQCIEQSGQCVEAARQAGKVCPPNARGTYEECIRNEAKGWVDCALAELACEERKARSACGF